MALDSTVLVARAAAFAAQAQPAPELGIDWDDVAEHCPFHGFLAMGQVCPCGVGAEEAVWMADLDAREAAWLAEPAYRFHGGQ